MTSADCGRVLSQAARDRLTITQLARVNRLNVPGRAMTLDLVVNVLLVLFVGNTLALVVTGNFGYILMIDELRVRRSRRCSTLGSQGLP
jgi:amino acid transporter